MAREILILEGSKTDDNYAIQLEEEIKKITGGATSIYSAHRNLFRLITLFKSFTAEIFRPKIIIAMAGWAAALPGVIAGIEKELKLPIPIIGVPLPSEKYPDAMDAKISMLRLPPDIQKWVHVINDDTFPYNFDLYASLTAIQAKLILQPEEYANEIARLNSLIAIESKQPIDYLRTWEKDGE